MCTCSPRSRAALQALSRSELQVLAKKEGIRANLKSEEIVRRLLQRHPKRGPRATAPSPEDSSLMNPTKARETAPDVSSAQRNIHDPDPQPWSLTSSVGSDSNDENDWVAGVVHPGQSRLVNHESRSRAIVPLSQQEQMPAASIPTKKALRFVRRELTELVDEKTYLLEVLDESDRVLQQNLKETDAAVRDANELVWMRVGIERHITSKMKKDRTVWDGTPFMSKRSQKKWKQYIEDDRRREEEAVLPFFHAPSGFSAGAKNIPYVLLHISSGNRRDEGEEELLGESDNEKHRGQNV